MTLSEATLKKVGDWINSEGYSVEFKAGNILQKQGYLVHHGMYAEEGGSAREIDLVSSVEFKNSKGLLRVHNIVECKWSKDKPWVVFTHSLTRMAPSACIAQSISSEIGSAIIWAAAGDARLENLSMFSSSEQGGFGGRQAFSKNVDIFYAAVQSCIGNAVAYVRDSSKQISRMVDSGWYYAALAMPVIVVEGDLLRAYFDQSNDGMKVEQKQHIRCYWRGFGSPRLITPVDIVTLEGLSDFSRKRFEETEILFKVMSENLEPIVGFLNGAEISVINVTKGSRGYTGLPPLIYRTLEARDSKNNKGT